MDNETVLHWRAILIEGQAEVMKIDAPTAELAELANEIIRLAAQFRTDIDELRRTRRRAQKMEAEK